MEINFDGLNPNIFCEQYTFDLLVEGASTTSAYIEKSSSSVLAVSTGV
jgi:hypothetical protein